MEKGYTQVSMYVFSVQCNMKYIFLVCRLSPFFLFVYSPLFVEDSQFDEHFLKRGLKASPNRYNSIYGRLNTL